MEKCNNNYYGEGDMKVEPDRVLVVKSRHFGVPFQGRVIS